MGSPRDPVGDGVTCSELGKDEEAWLGAFQKVPPHLIFPGCHEKPSGTARKTRLEVTQLKLMARFPLNPSQALH